MEGGFEAIDERGDLLVRHEPNDEAAGAAGEPVQVLVVEHRADGDRVEADLFLDQLRARGRRGRRW